jgi:flavin reductase (DIM6/NTAB) family NADH-FMN oxidoreductase RutF
VKYVPSDMNPAEVYQLMVSTIMPRPIAWISTVSSEGVSNIAPFSFFNGVTASPATLMFSAVNNRHGVKKDTVRNIEATGEFVVNVVSAEFTEAMVKTSGSFEYGTSEFEACGIPSEPAECVGVPRVQGVPVCFECSLEQIVHVGEGALAANLVIGLIKLVHIRDECLDENGAILSEALQLVGRMGGSSYVSTKDVFDIGRPK